MKESPDLFKGFKSNRYIHRFTEAISDSGLKIPMLRNIAFVQLDKALDMFLGKTYNEDEDIELLTLLAFLADPNNTAVQKAIAGNSFFEKIFDDANKFSKKKGVQNMLFEEELAILDFNTSIHMAEEKGEKRGEEKYEARINALNKWLHNNGRDDDIIKAAIDDDFRKTLFEEYSQVKISEKIGV